MHESVIEAPRMMNVVLASFGNNTGEDRVVWVAGGCRPDREDINKSDESRDKISDSVGRLQLMFLLSEC